jgi:hypothetical protein
VSIGIAVNGLGEEALHLAGMQVHRDEPVDARGLEHLRHEPGADRLARRRFLVLARVAVPGRDRDDAVGRRALCGIHHHEQLHQSVVYCQPLALIAADRLDDEEVGAADRILIAAVDLPVREGLEPGAGEVQAEPLGDLRPELLARPARRDHQALAVVGRDGGAGHQGGLGLKGGGH